MHAMNATCIVSTKKQTRDLIHTLLCSLHVKLVARYHFDKIWSRDKPSSLRLFANFNIIGREHLSLGIHAKPLIKVKLIPHFYFANDSCAYKGKTS